MNGLQFTVVDDKMFQMLSSLGLVRWKSDLNNGNNLSLSQSDDNDETAEVMKQSDFLHSSVSNKMY